MNVIPVLFAEKADCCGCLACYSTCPASAIYIEADEEGFLYPHIDAEKCIRCRKCETVCPIKRFDGGREKWA